LNARRPARALCGPGHARLHEAVAGGLVEGCDRDAGRQLR